MFGIVELGREEEHCWLVAGWWSHASWISAVGSYCFHCMNGIVGSHVSHAGWLLGLHEPKSVRVTMAPPKLDILSVCGDDLFGDRKSRFGEGSDA